MSKFIGKTEQKRLIKKLQMKYGAELEAIQAETKSDVETYGYIRLETEAKRLNLLDKIQAEEKHYR